MSAATPYFKSTLVVGDLHLKKDFNYEPMLSEIIKIVNNVKPERVVILGDVLHTHEKISMQCHASAVNFFTKLSETSKVYVLIGNHDRQNNSDFLTDIHPFNGISNEKIKIISKPLKEEGIIYVPYVPIGRFREALDTLNDDDLFSNVDLIFAHQEFKGAQMGCKRSSKGDVWSKDNPMVISGHIHEHQIIDNIMYLGTPIQHSFGDNSKKFVLLIDSNKKFISYALRNIRKKKILHLSYSEFMNLENIDPESDYKIIVTVSKGQAVVLKKSAKYLAFNKIAKMSLNMPSEMISDQEVVQEVKELMSVDDMMIKNILKDEYTINIYKELFNV